MNENQMDLVSDVLLRPENVEEIAQKLLDLMEGRRFAIEQSKVNGWSKMNNFVPGLIAGQKLKKGIALPPIHVLESNCISKTLQIVTEKGDLFEFQIELGDFEFKKIRLTMEPEQVIFSFFNKKGEMENFLRFILYSKPEVTGYEAGT